MTSTAPENTPLELKTCRECGADCETKAAHCWLCGADLKGQVEIVVAEIVDEPPPYAPGDTFFAVLSAIVAVVVLLVGIGAAVSDPGMAIGFAIIVVPALVATVVRAQQTRARQGYVTWGERLATFMVSVSLMFALLSLLSMAAIVAFIFYCFYALGTGQGF